MNEMERSIFEAMEVATQEVIRWEFMARVGIFVLITAILFIFLLWLILSTASWVEKKKKELEKIIKNNKRFEKLLSRLCDKNNDKLVELCDLVSGFEQKNHEFDEIIKKRTTNMEDDGK